MRSITEIGTFNSPEVDKWYQLYASLYLDCVDDNLRHFFDRCVDAYPIRNCEDEGQWPNLYIDAALKLFDAIKTAVLQTKEEWFEEYPPLKELWGNGKIII